MDGNNIRYKLTETYIENFDTSVCYTGTFDAIEAARSAMRDRMIKAFGIYSLGDPLDPHNPISVRQLERIDDPDGNAHADEFDQDFRVSNSYAWISIDRKTQLQWDISEISPIRRYTLIRGDIRSGSAKSGYIGLSATQYGDFGEAYAAMLEALLEACGIGDLKTLASRLGAKKLEEGDSYRNGTKRDPRFPEYYSEDTGFYLGMDEAYVPLDNKISGPVSFRISETLVWPD